jgi:hypothetical protein
MAESSGTTGCSSNSSCTNIQSHKPGNDEMYTGNANMFRDNKYGNERVKGSSGLFGGGSGDGTNFESSGKKSGLTASQESLGLTGASGLTANSGPFGHKGMSDISDAFVNAGNTLGSPNITSPTAISGGSSKTGMIGKSNVSKSK